MESNNKNNEGGDEHEQLLGTARKRAFNELTNDEDKRATGEEEDQPEQQDCSSKKNREENDMDLELGSFSREELIKLVRKQMGMTIEVQKQLETAKKEADAKLLTTQHKVEELTEEAKLNEEYQKLLEIVQLPHEKKEEIADDANAEKPMKIQLSLETWYDWLSFVPRHQLGQIVPMIGDRRFGSIVQKFLHRYGEITIDRIEIVAPYEEDPNGHPRVRAWQNNRPPLRFEVAEAQMPANIKNFTKFKLSYLDQSVLNFLQKFQQNGLLDNVNLEFDKVPSKDIIHPVLSHLLPLINGIATVDVEDSAQLVDIYDTGNAKEIYEMNMKMMEQTRFLCVSYDPDNFDAKTIDLYCRWLYQTARADGKSRVLNIGSFDMDSAPISLFIHRLKKDFLMATDPVIFFIRIDLPKAFQPLEDICVDNGKTKERLMIKMEKQKVPIPGVDDWEEVVLLISRYPLGSTKKWIEENQKELLAWDFSVLNEKTIQLTQELKVVPI